MRRATRQHSMPHHGRGHTATQHAPQWAGGAPQHSMPYHGEGTRTNAGLFHQEGDHTSTAPTPAKQTTQPQPQRHRRPQPPEHADRKAARMMLNQQNKLRMAPAKTPRTRTRRCRLPGGTDDNPSPAPPHHAQPLWRAGTTMHTARPTMRRVTRQHDTPHHGGEHTPTHHAPPWGGGTHQDSTPHHGGDHEPAK